MSRALKKREAVPVARRGSKKQPKAFAVDSSKSERTRKRLIEAAAQVVAREGYPKTSIAKITQEAGLASGSFYYYYRNREELLDELLPTLGKGMVRFILERIGHMEWGLEREMAGFRAYFEFLKESPEFFRIFTEAQVYVPEAYKVHLQWILNNFVRGLKKQIELGGLHVASADLMALAYTLTGIRNYATQMLYSSPASDQATVENMFRLYKQILSGLFKK